MGHAVTLGSSFHCCSFPFQASSSSFLLFSDAAVMYSCPAAAPHENEGIEEEFERKRKVDKSDWKERKVRRGKLKLMKQVGQGERRKTERRGESIWE